MSYRYPHPTLTTRRYSWESQTSSLLGNNENERANRGPFATNEHPWHYNQVPPHSPVSSAPRSPNREEWVDVEPLLSRPAQEGPSLESSMTKEPPRQNQIHGSYAALPMQDLEEDIQTRSPYDSWSDDLETPRTLYVTNGMDNEARETGTIASMKPPKLQHSQLSALNPNRQDRSSFMEVNENATPPNRNISNATGSTISRSFFSGFDGVHLSGDNEDDDAGQHITANLTEQWSREELMSTNNLSYQQRDEWNKTPPPPLPQEGMVYYPVPVPAALNMPKRLSQMPNTPSSGRKQAHEPVLHDGGQRKSSDMQQIQEKSEFVSDSDAASILSRKTNTAGVKKLPPQLRAALFFDHRPVEHTFEIKNNSAVATLDHFLDQSAISPVTYGPGVSTNGLKARRSGTHLKSQVEAEEDRSRVEADILGRRRLSATSSPSREDEQGEGAAASLADAIDAELSRRGSSHLALSASRPATPANALEDADRLLAENDLNDSKLTTGDAGANWENLDDFSNEAPTTLLAELQLRKQKLKERTRTAATSFPNGMHATLLELDAVEQIQKKRRKTGRTTLAWEEPDDAAADKVAEQEQNDDDLPLGMLYPQNKGLIGRSENDWDQPLGLLQVQAQEATESLSQRRNRLLGLNSPKPTQQPVDDEPDSDPEHAGETLAQRTRRLRARKALDEAIESSADGTHHRSVSNDFANEMMNQLDGLERSPTGTKKKQGPLKGKAEHADTEETLGQRRRRLQAEAARSRTLSGNSMMGETSQLQSLGSPGYMSPLAPALQTFDRGTSYEQGLRLTSGGSSIGPLVSLDPPRDHFVEDSVQKKNSRFGMLNDGHAGSTPHRTAEEQTIGSPASGRQVSVGWNWGTAQVVAGAPWQHQQLSNQGAIPEAMTDSQRRNIDLWRQSVVQ